MTEGAFYGEGSRVLGPELFAFMLDLELRRAVRSQDFVSVVTFDTAREWEGMTFPADMGTVHEVAGVVGAVVRQTDIFGHSGDGALALVLLDAGFEHAGPVVERIVARVENYQFVVALRIAVGAACYPVHAADRASLQHQASVRPIANLRRPAGPRLERGPSPNRS